MSDRTKLPLRLALTFGAACLAMPIARAQQAPAPDTASIWTLQDENASISTSGLTDRYYTNGLRLGWTSPEAAVPGPLSGMMHALWGDGRQRISVDLTQQIYTPGDTAALVPPKGDRPYAGVLLATLGLLSDTDTTRSTFSLGLGVVGPAALGEQVQNGFHDLIGQGHTNGWDSQLKNEPALQITSSRVWRLKTGSFGGIDTEALPELTVGVGTVRVYAMTGVTLRLGQGLDQDFGVARVRPGLSGGDVFSRSRNFGWYVFAGADGQAVARDVTLDGNLWQNSASVQRSPFVGEAEIGVALLIHGTRLTYTQVLQTAEFRHQKGGLHQFGSLALSVRF